MTKKVFFIYGNLCFIIFGAVCIYLSFLTKNNIQMTLFGLALIFLAFFNFWKKRVLSKLEILFSIFCGIILGAMAYIAFKKDILEKNIENAGYIYFNDNNSSIVLNFAKKEIAKFDTKTYSVLDTNQKSIFDIGEKFIVFLLNKNNNKTYLVECEQQNKSCFFALLDTNGSITKLKFPNENK